MSSDKPKILFFFREDFNGLGNIAFAWSQDHNFLALCGENNVLHIIDRQGRKSFEANLARPGKVEAIDWDKDGDTLAIQQTGLNLVTLWNISTKSYTEVVNTQTSSDRVSFIKWCKTLPVLAFGTDKGLLTFYYKKKLSLAPYLGKHTKKIISGDWNNDGLLVTGGEDNVLAVSKANGEVYKPPLTLKGPPRDICWARQKTDDRDERVRHITTVIKNQNISLIDIEENKINEINFQPTYGQITSYQWYGDGYIIIGFSKGVVCAISTHMKEIAKEINKIIMFPNMPITIVLVNDQLGKFAVASQNVIRFASITDWTELSKETIELPSECGKISKMSWSNDGQILVVTTDRGHVLGYLMSFPSLFDTSCGIAALQTSLTEITLLDCINKKKILGTVNLDIEPTFIKLSTSHLGVGSANMVHFYRFINEKRQFMSEKVLVNKKDYFGTVKMLAMNSKWVAVLSDKKCTLHEIEPNISHPSEERKFPANDSEKGIVYISLTEDFLLLLDETGKLRYYYIEVSSVVAEYKPENPILKVFPNDSGTKAICIDSTGCGFLYNPVSNLAITLPNFSANTEKVLWDLEDQNLFIGYEKEKIVTYLYVPFSLDGSCVIPLPEYTTFQEIETHSGGTGTSLAPGGKPVLLKNGYLFYHSKEGLKGMYLPTHSVIETWEKTDTEENHLRYYLQNIALNKFEACFKVAEVYTKYSTQLYEILGKQALKHLELDFAERAYQLCKNPGMVLAIQSVKNECEKYILMGYMAMFLYKYDLAEEFFLKSSRPELALEMRCDLNDWPSALKLSEKLSPERVKFIGAKVGLQLESQGKFHEARKYFEGSQIEGGNEPHIREHNKQCYAGIARTSARLGDVVRAISISKSLEDKQLTIEIGTVCESMKQFLEAAQLFESVGLIERAATIYIQIKQLKQALPLIEKINSPKLLRELAKAREAEKQYKEAEKAYEKANDWENVIRLNIQFLDGIEKAKDLLRNKCQTIACAQMLAEYSEKSGNRKEAIEFLLMAGKKEEAFIIAQSHDEMDTYRNSISKYDDKNVDEHLKIAQFYEGKNQWGKAAFHYARCDNFTKALKLYMQAGETFILEAIAMVGKVKNDSLTNQMVDYLTGDYDGIPKDSIYTLLLYKALGDISRAVKIALTIAVSEQEVGNYAASHKSLFEIFKSLKEEKVPIPYDLSQKLMIIHSYILAKRMMKLGDHMLAARLLIRIAKFISQFPKHAIVILTSVVMECARSGLKEAAYHWALVLMKPENRAQIDEKYKKKIEDIARKPIKTADEPEPTNPCPVCKNPINELEVDCTSCKNCIPFCIASGKHMTLKDWACCPSCKLPALYGEMKRVLESEPVCPMCNNTVELGKLAKVADPEGELKMFQAQHLEPKEEHGENEILNEEIS